MEPDSSSLRLSEVTLPGGVTIEEEALLVAQNDIRTEGGQTVMIESGTVVKVTGISYSYTYGGVILSLAGAGTEVIELGDVDSGFMSLVLEGRLVKVELK